VFGIGPIDCNKRGKVRVRCGWCRCELVHILRVGGVSLGTLAQAWRKPYRKTSRVSI
jgi:hypothetical protein